MHDRLKTKLELRRRHLDSDGICDRCGLELESTLHVLRDCPVAKRTWNCLIPKSLQADFFSLSLKDQVFFNIRSKEQTRRNVDWSYIFGVTIWRFWYWRNNFQFNNVNVDNNHMLQDICMRADEIQRFHKSVVVTTTFKELWINWSPPVWPWCKSNSDGSCKKSGLASAGGIIRDHKGQWIRGFSHNIGCCSITLAELQGLYQGLLLAWEVGIRWLLMEVDNLCVYDLVVSVNNAPNGYYQLILSIQEMLKRDWNVDLKHIYREANFAADALANYAHSLPLGLYIFSSPPAVINPFVRHDMQGVAYPRLVQS